MQAYDVIFIVLAQVGIGPTWEFVAITVVGFLWIVLFGLGTFNLAAAVRNTSMIHRIDERTRLMRSEMDRINQKIGNGS